MKIKSKTLFVTMSTALLGATVMAGSEATGASRTMVMEQLRSVPGLEMPAKAVSIVLAAKPEDRADVAALVTRDAATLNELATASVVAGIARAVPEVAPMAAAAAVAVHPKLTPTIVYAATMAARDQAGKITAAVSQVAPTAYDSVVNYAVQAAPSQQESILSALTATIPESQGAITKARSEFTAKGEKMDLGLLLARAKEIQIATYTEESRKAQSSASAPRVSTSGLSLIGKDNLLTSAIAPREFSIRSALERLDISIAATPAELVEPFGPYVRPAFTSAHGSAVTIKPSDTYPATPGSHNYSEP